jgi:hypothetical protein
MVRSIEVTGIYVIHTTGDRFAQNGDRCFGILWRPEHAGSGELHRSVSEPVHPPLAENKCIHDSISSSYPTL